MTNIISSFLKKAGVIPPLTVPGLCFFILFKHIIQALNCDPTSVRMCVYGDIVV